MGQTDSLARRGELKKGTYGVESRGGASEPSIAPPPMPSTEPAPATGNDLPAKDAHENGEKGTVSSAPAEDSDALKLAEDAEKKRQKKAKLGMLLLLLKQSIK